MNLRYIERIVEVVKNSDIYSLELGGWFYNLRIVKGYGSKERGDNLEDKAGKNNRETSGTNKPIDFSSEPSIINARAIEMASARSNGNAN